MTAPRTQRYLPESPEVILAFSLSSRSVTWVREL